MNEIRDWTKLLQPYTQAVEELKVKLKAIRIQYRELGQYSPIEFTTGRVKRISSIIEKAKRLNIPLERVEEMEDIAGLRIMVQFIDDIYTVVDLIKTRDGKDFKLVYTKDYVENPKESGYKSYHMIISYTVFTASGAREILVEIQIRTLAMNFWATIEHSLNYKFRDNIPLDLTKRLQNAAIAATNLDLEMAAISNAVQDAQAFFEEKSNVVTDITNKIKLIAANGDSSQAIYFQKKFDLISNKDNQYELDLLVIEINKYFQISLEES